MIDFLRAYNTREEYFVVEEIFEAILRPIISCMIKIVFSFNFFLLIFLSRITAFLNYFAQSFLFFHLIPNVLKKLRSAIFFHDIAVSHKLMNLK